MQPELEDKLREYVSLLIKWQKAINLVSDKDTQNIWERHILDSLQLEDYIDDTVSNIVDLGSGGGFPAIVLALRFPNKQFSLVESDSRKCMFLKECIRVLELKNVEICNVRIEEFVKLGYKFQMVTSRALASLTVLLGLSVDLLEAGGCCLFLKGKNVDNELKEAGLFHFFDVEILSSRTSKEARVLRIKNIREKQNDRK